MKSTVHSLVASASMAIASGVAEDFGMTNTAENLAVCSLIALVIALVCFAFNALESGR